MPSSQQIQVGIKFNADTSQAKQQIQSLQQTLQQIGNTPIGVTGGSIESAVQSAKQLEIALQKAVNVDTGKLNFSALNKSLASMGTNVTEVGSKLLSMGPQGQKAFQQLAQSISQAEIPARKLNGVLGRFADTLVRTIRWQVASTMIHGFISTVRSAVSYIEDLDKSLNAIQIVTQKNDVEMAHFAKTASKMAGQLSTVTKEYSNASLIFFQQGLDTAEVIERTNATIKLAKVTGDSVENISSKLTAIWNNFDDGTKNLEYYADVITKLGAATASSSDEIATGLQKFAAVADTVGLSYERATAALATVVAQTRQSAEIVGTSFKTIFARVEGLKLGETLEDDVTLNQYSAALAKIGVNILDSNNNLKDMDTILDDLGDRWNKLSEAQKVATAQTVAGVRQYSQFLALMNNYEEVRANENLAKESEGTLDKQFKTYQQSIEALDKEIEKAKQDVFASLFNADDLKGFKEGLVDVLGVVQNIVSGMGGLKGIIALLGTMLLQRYIPNIQNGINNIINSFQVWRNNGENVLSTFQQMVANQTSGINQNNILSSIAHGEKSEQYVSREQQSLYYTNEILAARKMLLSNAENMTKEQQASVQYQLDYVSALAESSDKLRQNLDRMREIQQAQENTVANENKKIAYNTQREKNNADVQEINRPFSTKEEAWNFNSGGFENTPNKKTGGTFNTEKADFLDTFIMRAEEAKNQYKNMGNEANKYNEDQIKNWNEQAQKIQEAIEQLRQYQKILRGETQGSKTEAGRSASSAMAYLNKTESDFRKEHSQELYKDKNHVSAYEAGVKASQPDYLMPIDPSRKEGWQEMSQVMMEMGSNSGIVKDNFTTILANAQVLKENVAGTNIDWETTSATVEGIDSVIKISQNSIKNISSTVSTLVNQSSQARKIQENINGTLNKSNIYLKNESKTMKTIGTQSKVYQTNLKNAKNELSASLNAAKNVEKQLRKAGINTDKLQQSIGKANSALRSGKGIETTFKNLNGELENTANTTQKVGDGLYRFSNGMIEAATISEEGRQVLHKVADSEYQITLKSKEADEAVRMLNDSLSNMQFPVGGLQGFVQGLGTFLQNATSVTMSIQMMTNGANMLSDAFAGNGNAITVITGAMMALRGVMLLLNAGQSIGITLGKLSIGNKVKEAAALKILYVQRMKEAQALKNETMEQFYYNAAKEQELIIEQARQSISKFGPVAGIAIAAAGAVALTTMIAISTSSKKTANHLKEVGEQAQKTSEDATKAAESAKEEYNSVKDLYNEYEQLYKSYKDTGEEKLELYNKTKELIDKLDLENYKLELLAGNYDLVNKKIREQIQLKTDNMVKTGEYSASMASRRIFAAADAESGGLLVRNNRIGTSMPFYINSNMMEQLLGESYQEKYGVSFYSTTSFGNKPYYDSITFAANTLGAYQLDQFYKDLLKNAQEKGLSDSTINALYQGYLNIDSSSREALDNAKTEFESQVNSLITQYVTNHEFTNIDDLTKIQSDLYDKNGELNTNSEIFKSLVGAIGITYKSLEEQKQDITEILELADIDLEKQIVASYGNLGELYNLQKQINEQYKLTTEFNLDEVLKATDITQQEFLDLFNSGRLNFNLIDWSKPKEDIQKQVKELIKEAQKAADEKTVDFYYTLSLSAQKNWKSGMTYSDIIKFLEDHTDLFDNEETGETGRLGITKEDFLALSITEQKRKLEEASGLSNLQKDYDNKILELQNQQEELNDKDQQFLRIYNEGRKATNIDLKDKDVNLLGILDYIKADDKDKEQVLADLGYRGDWDLYGAARNGDKTAQLLLDEDFLDAIHSEYLSIEKEIEDNNTALEATINEKSQLDTLAPRLEFENDITFSDLNIDEVDELVENLPELVDSIEELDDELPKNKKAQEQVALAIKQTEKGLKSLTDNYEDWKEALKSKDELAKATALKEMKDAFADIFDLTDELKRADMQLGSYFGNYLLENMDLVEKAADGDKDAILQLQRIAAEDILLQLNPDIEIGDNAWQSLQSNLNRMQELLDSNQLKIGEVDDTALKTSLTTMINDLGLSIDEASALLAGMGFDAEVVDGTREIKKTWYRPAEYDEEEKGGIFFPVLRAAAKMEEVTGIETIPALKIKSLNYVGGGNISTKKGGTGRLSSKNSGGERSKKEPKKSSDEIERYHRLNKTLDSLSKQYSRISSAKDAAFGAQRLKYIEQENKLLQQQYNTEKALLKEIEQNYSKDRSAIEAYGAIIDQNGVITNYDQIMKQQLDKLNSAYAQYNAGGLSDEIIEAREKEYEEFKEILSQFEETNSTYLDQLEKVEEAIRKQITNALEGIKAKVELELELPNQQLKMVEYKLQELENRAFSSSEKIALWGQQAEVAANSFGHYADAFRNVLTMSVYDTEGNRTGGFGLTADQANRLMSGDANVLNEAGITGENAQEIMEALKEYQDNLLEEYSKVREARQSVEEELLNQLNEYTEAIDQQISKLEKLNSIANNYKTLINTTGKELLGISADIMNSINATIMNTSKNQMAALKAEQDALESNLVEAREKLANALASGDSEVIQYWKNVNQEIENSLLETKDTLLSTINDFVESATEILQERIKESFDNFAKQIYGMTFEDAQASYDRYKTLSDDYLKDYQKIYELSKLTRQVEQSIDNTNNIKGKQILRDLQAEINEYQAEGVQMTQYEVDYLNKKYELRKAEIALEEAQNATDQVRLSRNADGGWGYVYTANQQNIDKAQQTYEDKLYALQELNTKAIEDTQATILQLQTEYQNAMMEIWENKELSPEQISARVNELTDYYTRLINTQSKTLNSALGNNNELYTEDWENYNKLTGYRISTDENYIDKFEETWLGKQQQGIMSALDFFELYKNTIGTYDNSNSILGQCYSAFEDYSSIVRDSLSSAGLDLEEFAFVVSNEMDKIEESSREAKDEGEDLANLLSETLPNTMNEVESVQKKTTNMFNNMKLAIDGVNNALTLLIQKLQEYNGTTITNKSFTPPGSAGSTVPYTASVEGSGGSGENPFSGREESEEKYYLKKHPRYGFEWSSPNEYSENPFDENYYKKGNIVVGYATPEEKDKYEVHYTFSAAGNSDLANEIILWLQREKNKNKNKHQYIAYDTGGYTGAFGPEGRLAMLHEKELVLNKQDTSNMLKMIDIARQVIYDFNSSLPNFTAQTLSNALFNRSNGETNQNITIEAHFPNAVNHLEIEEAFRNLANYSAQNAYNLDLSQNINIF